MQVNFIYKIFILGSNIGKFVTKVEELAGHSIQGRNLKVI